MDKDRLSHQNDQQEDKDVQNEYQEDEDVQKVKRDEGTSTFPTSFKIRKKPTYSGKNPK